MQGIFKLLAELFEPPDGGPFSKAILGYLLPGAIVLYAAYAIFVGETIIPLRGLPTVPGFAGCLVALIYVGVAALFHFHWAWGLSHELWHRCGQAKMAAAFFILACIVALIIFLASHDPAFPFL